MPSTKLIINQKKKQEEAKKAKKENKTDLAATPKRESTAGGIHAGKPEKGKDIEIKKKSKVKIKSGGAGGIHAGKPPKGKYEKKPTGVQAAEVEKVKKSSGPTQKKKLSAVSAKAKDKAIAKAEKTSRAKAKKDMPTGRSSAASGYAKREEIGKRKGYKKHASKPSGKR